MAPTTAALVAAAAGALLAAVPAAGFLESAATAELVMKGLAPRVAAHKAKIAAGAYLPTTVSTPYGPVAGVGGSVVNQYLGIPYAAPPVGPLRWRPPQPPAVWTEPLNATWWAPGCIQSETTWTFYTGQNESCLYLNIYAPANATAGSNLPVMFFMHGGSWEFGSGSFLLYDGENVVNLVRDVIVVTINYRLNVFGFLAGDALRAESSDGSVGNYGFQDQRAALSFVIDVIGAFGGDPNQITMYGESAGGGSTSDHLVAPRSAGMFQRAIIESGAWADWSAQPYNISATRLPQVAAAAGCAAANDTLACLRATDANAVYSASKGVTSAFLTWSPVIDGVELPDDPRALLAAGKVQPVPIILGFNANEGTLFDSAPQDLNASDYEAAIAARIGAALAPTIAAAYPPGAYASPWWAISAVMGDSQMVCPGKAAGAALTNPATRPGAPPVFVYYYTHVLWLIEYIVDLFKPLGCFHGSELVNVFDLNIILWGAGEPQLADTWVSYWTNFAATGNPNAAGLPRWTPYTSAAADLVAQIDTGAAGPNVTMVSGLKATLCQLWGNITIDPATIWGDPAAAATY